MKPSFIKIFFVFFKIGLFTYGGGVAMISVVKEMCVDKEKWLDEKTFVNMVAIAESTPGPIAVNMATYVGFKQRGIIGSICATLGNVLPSMVIIYIISLFFDDLLKYKIINDAFFGIRIGVSILITRVAINLFKTELKDTNDFLITIIAFLITFLLMFMSSLFNIDIDSICIIIGSIIFSIIYAFITVNRK